MARIVRLWFSPLQFFNRGIWNVLLNLGGTFIIAGLAWVVAVLTSSAVGIVAGIALVLLALLVLALLALRRAVPPQRLRITFDKRDVQDVKAMDALGNVLGDARYFHFKVEAPVKIRNCSGRLVRVEIDSGGAFQPYPFKPPEDLTLDSKKGLEWPEIEPDLPARLNLVATESTRPGLAFLCVPDHTPHGNMTQLTPGRYRLTTRVSAEGVADAEARFVVQVGHAWNQLQVELSG
jgi:hypothetical protein